MVYIRSEDVTNKSCDVSARELTNGDAVGPSSMASSSAVNGSHGIRTVLIGTRSKMTTGKPMAACKRKWARLQLSHEMLMLCHLPMVCVIAKVAPKPTNCTVTNRTIRDFRTWFKGSSGGISERSRIRYNSFSVMPLFWRASAPIYQLYSRVKIFIHEQKC